MVRLTLRLPNFLKLVDTEVASMPDWYVHSNRNG